MKGFSLVIIVALTFGLSSCKEDEPKLDPVTASLVSSLEEELKPLSQAPTLWADSELAFLDAYADKTMVGFGEATHGTSEFFKAKHRMFKYMVEKHGFKIFAIEADFGESILINEAIQSGDKSRITGLMKDKMQFWTWRTNEVRDMLYWMCDYNLGKAESEKLQYWGFDCQYNVFHTDMVKERLAAAHVSFQAFAEPILDEAKSATANRFAGYQQAAFDNFYYLKLAALADSVKKYEAVITAATSAKQYQLTVRLLKVVQQASEVVYYSGRNSRNFRDEYMADNAAWLNDYLGGSPMVLWAHNFHISVNDNSRTMGYYLAGDFPNEYAPIGFLFSKGHFMAVTIENDQFKGLAPQTLDADPKDGSINDVMYHANSTIFTVNVSRLQSHEEWNSAFTKGMKYFDIGSGWNNKPDGYYQAFEPVYFDQFIYINTTTVAQQLQ